MQIKSESDDRLESRTGREGEIRREEVCEGGDRVTRGIKPSHYSLQGTVKGAGDWGEG